MLRTARHAINEGLLGGCVQEVVAHHERQPSSLHQAGEDLADTRCQGDGAEVGWVGGVVGCLLLAQQVHYANLPCRGDGLGGPAAVIHVQQCGQQGGTPLDDGVGDLVSRAGADEDLRLEMTPLTSSSVKGAVVMGTDGCGHPGIHSGWLKVLGVVEYTREKYSSACSWPKDGWMEV